MRGCCAPTGGEIPAYAGMTVKGWVPAYAGMTAEGRGRGCAPSGGEIPAYAGMTAESKGMADAVETTQSVAEQPKGAVTRLVTLLMDISAAQMRRRARASWPMRIFDWVIDISAFAGALIVLYVAGATGLNVLLRFLPWTDPPNWALPTTEFSLLYLTFLAAPVVLRREGHVRMTAITERLGHSPRLWLYIIGSALSAVVCGVLGWNTLDKTLEEIQKGAVLLSGIAVPRAGVTWIIPYGFALLTIQFLRMGVNAFRAKVYTSAAEEAGV